MKILKLWTYMENNDIKKPSELNEYFVDSYDDVNGCINLKNLEEYNINKIHDGMRFYFRLIEYKTYSDSKPETFKQETKNRKF